MQATTIVTVATFSAEQVLSLTDAIIGASKQRGAVAKLARAVAEQAYNDRDKQSVVAEFLTSVTREVTAKRDAYIKYLTQRGMASEVDTFRKSCVNQITYAVTVAGQAAGCKFVRDGDGYRMADLPAANETKGTTANGRDANSQEQSAALVAAAEAAPVLTAGDKAAHLDGILTQLLAAGYTLAEVEAAWHAKAAAVAAAEVAAEVAESATVAQAPAILERKMADVNDLFQGKAKPARAPRKSKAAASA